ncbi:MAG: NADH dehydrogenase (quinone) subunit D [Phycisphaerae bacterium]|nr:MAG: NADH dehydrogenase (quinone) subunit D [Planctomycetota bacterium]KAB2940724.1 MAG: NADH dehydrogenase (quinone) subunit D [Phycisphaerae bacterium]MBE7458468.1 NADH dehydrogenase (quinone) subunit D [Planctomycetia bacterium]MCK6464900.1 NADH dehydrogenase (quinone) subunit D [Phycisphaerae bacterium]MCL4719211.1 NADH dehydrogenase (quinone) subunit D [Phycisphaerae bacterium]
MTTATYNPPEPSTFAPEEPGGDLWTLNFGPQHPATHTTLRLVLELDGERVLRATPHIGYLHSGFEKLGEHLNYNQYVVVTDRMNYVSPMANNLAWHHACEKLFDIEITPRCKVIRTICAELARIQDHLLCVGAAALDLGALTAFLYGFNEREMIYDLFEEICGARFTVSYTRVGGLMQDVPPEWPGHVKAFCKHLPTAIADLESLLNRNRIFIERTKGIGVIGREDAINWGLTGPLARSAGVRRDLRKDEPYLCYADNWDGKGSSGVSFKVPISTGGDVLARYLVRLEEIKQSLSILTQLVDDIPSGPINLLPDDKKALPDKREVYFSIEGLIHHFETIMTNRGFTPPIGEAYGCQETANGELGFYLVSDGGNCAYRARCRPPSFINYQCFPRLVEGHQISDVVAILGSLNIIAAELDR